MIVLFMASLEDYYHIMQMCDIGPWYEQNGPTEDEAFNLIKTHHLIKNKYVPEWIIRSGISDEIVAFGGLGSWRGFHSFTLSSIVESCVIWHETRYKPAIKKIAESNSINNWVNHILYRCPDKDSDEKMGLRVHFHQEMFNNMIDQSSSNNSSSSKSDSSVSE